MSEGRKWQCELEEYIRQGEPDRAEKSAAWQTAIGLQAVDNLQISEYLLETAITCSILCSKMLCQTKQMRIDTQLGRLRKERVSYGNQRIYSL